MTLRFEKTRSEQNSQRNSSIPMHNSPKKFAQNKTYLFIKKFRFRKLGKLIWSRKQPAFYIGTNLRTCILRSLKYHLFRNPVIKRAVPSKRGLLQPHLGGPKLGKNNFVLRGRFRLSAGIIYVGSWGRTRGQNSQLFGRLTVDTRAGGSGGRSRKFRKLPTSLRPRTVCWCVFVL